MGEPPELPDDVAVLDRPSVWLGVSAKDHEGSITRGLSSNGTENLGTPINPGIRNSEGFRGQWGFGDRELQGQEGVTGTVYLLGSYREFQGQYPN